MAGSVPSAEYSSEYLMGMPSTGPPVVTNLRGSRCGLGSCAKAPSPERSVTPPSSTHDWPSDVPTHATSASAPPPRTTLKYCGHGRAEGEVELLDANRLQWPALSATGRL